MLNLWGFCLFSAWLPGNKSSQLDMSQCNRMPAEKPKHRKFLRFQGQKSERSQLRDISNRRTYTWCSQVHAAEQLLNLSTIKQGNIHMLNPSHPSQSASWKHRWKPGLNWFRSFNEDKLFGQQPELLRCGREFNCCTTLACSSSAGNLL